MTCPLTTTEQVLIGLAACVFVLHLYNNYVERKLKKDARTGEKA